jgi:ElaB/YqjD/DUF883 family membrane-anchored ribosome-binding protein
MPATNAEEIKEKLIENARTSLSDAEDLLREAASTTGDRATELRERALAALKRTRETLYDAQDAIVQKGRRAVRATDDYVHDNPWQSISIAAVAGLLLGVLISRR